jgi:3-deoxy-manno-octulosonate cytidylyltransferase (CMP-KDO synthetase)
VAATAIIPARYASTRLPGKPLLRETGKYLIQHVCERVAAARRIAQCIVATDDPRIADAVCSFGGTAVLTSPKHATGTDRVAEVVRGLSGSHLFRGSGSGGSSGSRGSGGSGSSGGAAADLILNVQGDEPEIEPDYLDLLVERMEADADCPVATLAAPFPPEQDPRDPACVKVVVSRHGRALYFSRSLVPYPREERVAGESAGPLLHLGVYAFRRDFLLQFAGWEPAPLERIEKLEQLRVLEYGHPVAVERVGRAMVGIDTPADYAAFVARWKAASRTPAGRLIER